MPISGFDFRRRRNFPGWGAQVEWPPINPVALDPALYTYISETTVIENGPPTTTPGTDGAVDPFIMTSWGFSTSHIGPELANSGSSYSYAVGTANRIVGIPFQVYDAAGFNARLVAFPNGGAVSGNIDVGVYTRSGTTVTRVASTGSTAQAGVAPAVQTISVNWQLAAGNYYLAYVMDNGTGQLLYRTLYGNYAMSTTDHWSIAATFPLPASATASAAQVGGENIPLIGLSLSTTLP